MFHIDVYSLYFAFFCKMFFPRIKTYVKLDASIVSITSEQKLEYPNFKNPRTIKEYIKTWQYNSIDLLTVETTSAFDALKAKPFFQNRNIHLIPNGLDDGYNKKINFAHKQKTIITVGRLGSYQKNTELLLEVIAQLHLYDWKIKLIGELETKEQNFQSYLDTFFAHYPALKAAVTLTGSISDSEALQKEYEAASIFVFPSRHESFGIATLEAASAGCYIVATNVGAAYDITKQGTLGFICDTSSAGKQNEDSIKQQMIEHLQKIIDGTISIADKRQEQSQYVQDHFLMQTIISKQCFKQWIK